MVRAPVDQCMSSAVEPHSAHIDRYLTSRSLCNSENEPTNSYDDRREHLVVIDTQPCFDLFCTVAACT